jgi:hypothetical protein
MKNYQLLDIKKAWNELKGFSGSKGYYLPLVKNIKAIDIELEAFDLIKEKTPKFGEFLKEKETLVQKFAIVDSEGNPTKSIEDIDGVQYYKYDVDKSREEEFNKEGTELVNKYQDTLQEMKDKENIYIDTMNAECTISFAKIKESDLPSEMTPKHLELIFDFVTTE